MKHLPKLIKRPNFKAGLFCYLPLLLCSVQPAGAAVTATATIDWSTFTITPIDIGNGLPTLIWNNQFDRSQANANCLYCDDSSTFESAENWSTGTSAMGAGYSPDRSSSASTSVNQLKANASIDSIFANYNYNPTSASNRYGDFTVQGSGLLLFKANYSLTADIGTDLNKEGSASVAFTLRSVHPFEEGSAFQNFNTIATPRGGLPSKAEAGILAVALAFNDGWVGSLSGTASVNFFDVNVVSNVPIPATFWLFGTALAGITALRRPSIKRS